MYKYRPPYGPRYVINDDYLSIWGITVTSTFVCLSNNLYLIPVIIPFETRIIKLGIFRITGGGRGNAISLAIYTYDNPNWTIINKIEQIPDILTDIAVGRQEGDLVVPVVLPPGPYYFVLNCNRGSNIRASSHSGGVPFSFTNSVTDIGGNFAYIRKAQAIFPANNFPDTLDLSVNTFDTYAATSPFIYSDCFVQELF